LLLAPPLVLLVVGGAAPAPGDGATPRGYTAVGAGSDARSELLALVAVVVLGGTAAVGGAGGAGGAAICVWVCVLLMLLKPWLWQHV